MRGKVPTFHPPSGAVGITPAYAGKRRAALVRNAVHWDHPRVCGEKLSDLFFCSIHSGSPPRMRGKEVKTLLHFNRVGITPAYAGKRAVLPYAPAHSGDHPRVCGEKARMRSGLSQQKGSPPRMRGKENKPSSRRNKHRITPAYAGKRAILYRST